MTDVRTSKARSTEKKDKDAPRGLFRHPAKVWGIRFTCGAGHIHEEKVGRIKEVAKDTHAKRRGRARSEPGWCPRIERRDVREQKRQDQAREAMRVMFAD